MCEKGVLVFRMPSFVRPLTTRPLEDGAFAVITGPIADGQSLLPALSKGGSKIFPCSACNTFRLPRAPGISQYRYHLLLAVPCLKILSVWTCYFPQFRHVHFSRIFLKRTFCSCINPIFTPGPVEAIELVFVYLPKYTYMFSKVIVPSPKFDLQRLSLHPCKYSFHSSPSFTHFVDF